MKRGKIDIILFASALGLMLFSLVVVFSASSTYSEFRTGAPDTLFNSHLFRVILGFIALAIFTTIKIDFLRNLSRIILILAVVLLIATIVFGTLQGGAVRRLFGFQTSDFARLALIIHLSALIAKKGDEIKNLKNGFLPVLFWIFLCAGLIMLQPNFSTAFILIVIGFSMLLIGGAQIKHIFNTVLVSLPLLVAYLFSASYRYDRIFDYASILSGNVPVNKHVIYSIRGLGNGGIWGVGMGASSQRDLFLPEAYGDFVFSVVGEEYGFIGVTIVLAVFLLILWRGFQIAKNTTDKFSQLLAFGITFSFSLYAFINAGVSCGLFPATGIPMPFISYGGTAIFFNAIGIGILLNLSTYINSQEAKFNSLALSNE